MIDHLMLGFLSSYSGTDDDLPPSCQNRGPKGSVVAGNGRSILGSVPFSRQQCDMQSQIHFLEQEAYSSVLRAFLAQSDSISWDQLDLITHLKRELQISEDEHKDLYGRVKADDIIQRIKEWRQSGQMGIVVTSQAAHEPPPSATGSIPHKKQKTSQTVPTFGTMPLNFQGQPNSYAKHGAPSLRGRKPKPGQPYLGFSSVKHSLPSTGPVQRGRFSSGNYYGRNEGNETEDSNDPLIGRKVLTRWPDDNNFYEAVISDYNPLEGLHALVYDINTIAETWEWVNINEIPSEDIRWVGDDPVLSHKGGADVATAPGARNRDETAAAAATPGRGKGNMSSQQMRKEQLTSSQKPVSDIEIVNTDTLIKEVEKIFDTSNPDAVELDRAKKMLKVVTLYYVSLHICYHNIFIVFPTQEQEEALVGAITMLADASEDETDDERTVG